MYQISAYLANWAKQPKRPDKVVFWFNIIKKWLISKMVNNGQPKQTSLLCKSVQKFF